MKQIFCLILTLCFILTVTGCSERPTRNNAGKPQTSNETVQTVPEKTEETTLKASDTTAETITSDETKATTTQKEGLEFIGMEIGPDTVLPNGIEDMGGWIATDDFQYAYALMEWDGQTMIWLEEFIKHDADGYAYFRVLDVLIVPMEPDTSVVGMMIKNDEVDMATFGLAVYTDSAYLEDVRRVWTFDMDSKTIIEIPADGWVAVNEGYGV